MTTALRSRILLTTITLLGACLAPGISTSPEDRRASLDPDFERFTAQKRALEKQLSNKYQIDVPPIVWAFFDAAQKGDWLATSNLFNKIEAGSSGRGREAWLSDQL